MLTSRSREERTFERLYRRHVGDVYRYALAVMSSPADAEDITQTVFLNAYRSFRGGQRPRQPLNWLIAIAHNACRQRFRQAARRPTEVALDADVADRTIDDEAPRADDLRRGLSHLAFNQRAALVMRELEGRSYAEIAEVLGVSNAAVETLIFRARRALREQLGGSLTCSEAERAISRQLDGVLDRAGKGALRAHLRSCADCASLARRMRAQRGGFKSLAALPLPAPFVGLFGGGGGTLVGIGAGAGGTGAAGGLAVKAALIGATVLIASGAGYESVRHAPSGSRADVPAGAEHRPDTPAGGRLEAGQSVGLGMADASARRISASSRPHDRRNLENAPNRTDNATTAGAPAQTPQTRRSHRPTGSLGRGDARKSASTNPTRRAGPPAAARAKVADGRGVGVHVKSGQAHGLKRAHGLKSEPAETTRGPSLESSRTAHSDHTASVGHPHRSPRASSSAPATAAASLDSQPSASALVTASTKNHSIGPGGPADPAPPMAEKAAGPAAASRASATPLASCLGSSGQTGCTGGGGSTKAHDHSDNGPP